MSEDLQEIRLGFDQKNKPLFCKQIEGEELEDFLSRALDEAYALGDGRTRFRWRMIEELERAVKHLGTTNGSPGLDCRTIAGHLRDYRLDEARRLFRAMGQPDLIFSEALVEYLGPMR